MPTVCSDARDVGTTILLSHSLLSSVPFPDCGQTCPRREEEGEAFSHPWSMPSEEKCSPRSEETGNSGADGMWEIGMIGELYATLSGVTEASLLEHSAGF